MTERELLELAAKAAGIKIGVWHECIDDFYSPWRGGSAFDLPEGGYWNPLADDGDALRLADNLHMAVYFSESGKTVEAPDGPGPEWEEKDYRRAIVRAAAEIGKGMK